MCYALIENHGDICENKREENNLDIFLMTYFILLTSS